MAKLVADVSSFQPENFEFFEALAMQGVKAVIVKLTEGSADGTAYVNPKAQNQINNARRAGLLVHAYHFARFISIQDAKNEADFFVKTANKMGITSDSVMAVDLEADEIKSDLNNKTNAFLQYVKDSGYPNVDYYSMASWFWNGILNPDIILAKNKWVANYGVSQPGVDNVGTWQFKSTWEVYGIKIDMSYDFSGFYTDGHKNIQATNPTPIVELATRSFVDDLGVTWYLEKGTFTVTENVGIVLRWGATTKSKEISVLPKGSVVKYDAFAHSGGYVWIRQPRANGYGYLPTGNSKNGNRLDYWGKFE